MNIFNFFKRKKEALKDVIPVYKISKKYDYKFKEDLEVFLVTLQNEKRVTLDDKVIEKISDSWFTYGFGNYISLDNIIEKFEAQWEKSNNSLVLSHEIKKLRISLEHKTRWAKDDIGNKLFEENKL